MQPLNVVIAQEDRVCAEHLANALHPHFRNVSIARDAEELRRNTLRNFLAGLAVIDLELMPLDELATYCKEFPNVTVICTHRAPDDKMWMQVLAVGVSDFCHTLDVRVIVEAARGKVKLANAKAA